MAGRDVVIFEDEISTGGTLVSTIETLKRAGARTVHAGAVHGCCAGLAVEQLRAAEIESIVVTNTVSVPAEKHFDKLTVLNHRTAARRGHRAHSQRRQCRRAVRIGARMDSELGQILLTTIDGPRLQPGRVCGQGAAHRQYRQPLRIPRRNMPAWRRCTASSARAALRCWASLQPVLGIRNPATAPRLPSSANSQLPAQLPLFERIEVNSEHAHPLFRHLKQAAPGALGTEAIKRNFTKFSSIAALRRWYATRRLRRRRNRPRRHRSAALKALNIGERDVAKLPAPWSPRARQGACERERTKAPDPAVEQASDGLLRPVHPMARARPIARSGREARGS